MTATHWPGAWGDDFRAVCAFYKVRAHRASAHEVLLLTHEGAPCGRVPINIAFEHFQKSLPLIVNAYEIGVLNGRAQVKAKIAGLLAEDPDYANLNTEVGKYRG